MHWELWDTESANLVEDFATEDEALQAVREILAANRPDYIDALALGAMYDEGESREEELPPGLSGAELQSRLAQSTEEALADAARSVHDRIRNWLTEEGWHIEEIADQNKRFNAMVTTASGARVNTAASLGLIIPSSLEDEGVLRGSARTGGACGGDRNAA